jgi:hypothetical protein
MGLVDPAGVDYGEFGTTGFGGELLVGEWGCVGFLFRFGLEPFDVIETEDLAAAHEVNDIAGGAVDGVHADEMAFAVDADGVEAVVVYWSHDVEGVVGIAQGPAFIVGEDGGDVVELGDREVRRERRLRDDDRWRCKEGGEGHYEEFRVEASLVHQFLC